MDGMRIGELARRSGIPASTLRYYEAEGLLPADRAGNGYRVYGPDAVDRLAFIGQAKHLDLPLPAVRELAIAWESEPCRSVRARYRPLLVERSGQVAERLVALEALRATLTTAIDRLDALPDRDGPCETTCAFLDQGPDVDDAPRADRVPELLPLADAAPVACTLDADGYAERTAAWRDLAADGTRVLRLPDRPERAHVRPDDHGAAGGGGAARRPAAHHVSARRGRAGPAVTR